MDYPFRISEHIFLLGNHYFATYLITGQRSSILIDPGVSFTADQIVDQIKTLGLAPSDIEKLFITGILLVKPPCFPKRAHVIV